VPPAVAGRRSLTLCVRPIGRPPTTSERSAGNSLPPDHESAFAVEHSAGRKVALGGGDDIAAEAIAATGRLAAQRR
jgi:hypothetical protein